MPLMSGSPLSLLILKMVFYKLKELSFLLDKKFHLATWGDIYFAKKYADFTLGLTAEALYKAFLITGLPDTFVLQLPIEGPFGNVTLNKTAAAAKISLLLSKTVTQDAPGTGAFGGILDILGDIVNDQSATPKPKKPYPWGKSIGKLDKKPLDLKRDNKKENELVNRSISLQPMYDYLLKTLKPE